MERGDWTRLKELFQEAVELSREEREAFLRERCATDDALRDEVRALLDAHDAVGDTPPIIVPPAPDGPADSRDAGAFGFSSTCGEKPGDRIGAYQLLERLGEGGFGTVFLAEQSRPVRRRVALKIIKPGMDTRHVIARFEAERQALAMMDHPHIARVFDGGATESGRPYFVMEMVQGHPVTRYCDENRLPVRERLEVFQSVCAAVQHAHQKGVIHRDLKPNNVLISTVDGKPVAKVIDFGIAKAVAAETPLSDFTVMTELRQMVGTPLYMSPEQAEGSADIDTRSDVYSLGVMLYELLAGATPFDARQLRTSSAQEIQRILREVDPPRPSTRFSALCEAEPPESGKAATPAPLADGLREQKNGSQAARIATARGTDVDRLLRQLRGDLDWVVMKAVEKDRARRYQSASDLALDLQHVLRHEPVMAGPPGTAYRLRKLIRRHRTTVIAASLVFAALVMGVIGTTVGMVKARRNEQSATKQAVRSNQVAGLLKDMLEGIDPTVAKGRDTTILRQILDRTAARIDVKLADQPDLQAEMCDLIGGVYNHLALFADAERMHEKARQVQIQLHGEHSLEAVYELAELGSLRVLAGDFENAETLLREALRQREEIAGPDHPEVGDSLRRLADVLDVRGNSEEAERLLRQALDLFTRCYGEEHAEVALTLEQLGKTLRGRTRAEESESVLRKALALDEKLYGEEHSRVAATLYELATTLMSEHKMTEAEDILRRTVAMQRKLLTANHTETADSILGLATVLYSQGKLDESEALFRENLSIMRGLVGEDHVAVAGNEANFASILMNRGQIDDAEAMLRHSLQVYRRVYGDEHPNVATLLSGLGRALAAQDKLEEAEAAVAESLNIQVKIGRPDDTAPVVSTKYQLVLIMTKRAWVERLTADADDVYHRAAESVRMSREVLATEDQMFHSSPQFLYLVWIQLGGALVTSCSCAERTTPPMQSADEAAATLQEAESYLLKGLEVAARPNEGLVDVRAKARLNAMNWLVDLYTTWNGISPSEHLVAEGERWRNELRTLTPPTPTLSSTETP